MLVPARLARCLRHEIAICTYLASGSWALGRARGTASPLLIYRAGMLALVPTLVSLLPSSHAVVSRRTALGLFGTTATFATTSWPAYAASTGAIPSWTLANGVKFPTLALNTAGLTAAGSEIAFTAAIANGITHVDFHPGIERDGVAKVLNAGADRSKLFLTTKIRKPAVGTDPSAAGALVTRQLEEDLGVLGVSSVDMLMLRDSPDCAVMQAQWAAVEAAKAAGFTRSVGLINYCDSSLKCILATAKVKPDINYFMYHAGMKKDPRTKSLRALGETNGVRTFAYGALGEPGPSEELLASPVLTRIGEAHGKSVAEVALRWTLQSGVAVSVRPTSDFGAGRSACPADGSCAASVALRARAFEWKLTPSEMKEIDGLTSPGGNPTLFSSLGCPDSFFANK